MPALFDEANKLRRLTVEVMRRLDGAGIDSAVIDLPGCNESTALLAGQTIAGWRSAAAAAAAHFSATHVLALRGGALVSPGSLPGWRYAPIGGARILRGLIRARILAAKEAGRNETHDSLAEMARRDGIDLAGHVLSAEMFGQVEQAEIAPSANQSEIAQATVGGAALWLRAEPGDDPAQADAIAAIVAVGMM